MNEENIQDLEQLCRDKTNSDECLCKVIDCLKKRGATGPTGPTGPQGIQGPTGATGATGATHTLKSESVKQSIKKTIKY